MVARNVASPTSFSATYSRKASSAALASACDSSGEALTADTATRLSPRVDVEIEARIWSRVRNPASTALVSPAFSITRLMNRSVLICSAMLRLVIVDGVSNANAVWVPVRSVSRLPGVALSTPVERYCSSAPIAVNTPSASMNRSGASMIRGRLKNVSRRLTTIRCVRPRSSGAGSAAERVVARATGWGGLAAGYMCG